ncbi:MAG: nickel ABC transporter permease [Acidiphilium sp. 37-64-53]|uniref:ABC transporter permease n=1 Tax=Acidiphilium TaxID=522 RepID=UPI000BC97C77|nr:MULTISPECIES: ABC transporter permease [Acidiphilium]OYW00647.1 MAG: nickel ABC transporter permease [Acidiphilium sp. 37-64-53]HQT85745.1 ABC transporter permease [Acidiphilium rubrum]
MTAFAPVTRPRVQLWFGTRARGRNRHLIAGVAIIGTIVLMAIFAPLLTRYDPITQDFTATLQGPSWTHLLGTDNLGRDLWSRVLYGARTDLFLATAAVAAPFVIGTVIGALSGYFGGWFDVVVMRIADVVVAFPFYVLVISLVFILGNGVGSIFAAISIVSWVAYARIVRAEALVLNRTDFMDALRVSGLGTARIVFRHLVPNVVSQAIVYAMSDIVANIGVIVTLSYFGLGIVPPTPGWGSMMADGQPFFAGGYYDLMLIPAAAVILTSFGLSLIGDGLANALRVKT